MVFSFVFEYNILRGDQRGEKIEIANYGRHSRMNLIEAFGISPPMITLRSLAANPANEQSLQAGEQ